jgi:hypothetical protein
VGLGQDPPDREQLPYAYDDGLQALPTPARVLGYPGFWAKDPATGIDWVKLLHGEQSLELLAPLPAAAMVRGLTRVTTIVDKGAGKGALMYSERDITEAGGGRLLAVSRSVSFMRGDGGFAAAGPWVRRLNRSVKRRRVPRASRRSRACSRAGRRSRCRPRRCRHRHRRRGGCCRP